MDKQSRREALRQYKETKRPAGIFAVRCAASGQVWVGASRNLDQQQNGLWFGLRLGTHPNKVMQAAWKAHGEAAFALERLETIDDEDLSALALSLRLKDAEQRWRDQLGAGKVAG
ncbi:GIY-YIG nuclease family protein [Phenylobacterium soli]|uniref:GIY-YIG nuclease family protein n=1 Tax=Phenylobacterium soli TaxID=2170551 RepID=A0A328AR88_9CAUL|nr:GIY-YIG nuclease family protein [Phenylobacterium soli]RAK56034.1 GIY-YIG nuclease family protein [Phenylobacterium soli]